MSCQCKGVEAEFDDRLAQRELRWYRRRGPRKTTRILLELIRSAAPRPESLLDIGGGVGAIQHALAEEGITAITSVDASPAYLAAARDEAARRAYPATRKELAGDFVDRAAEVSSADIVTLDRVLCCYDDVESLVRLSAAKARTVYAIVYPPVSVLTRTLFKAINVFLAIRKSLFRGYLHESALVNGLLKDAGFEQFEIRRRLLWQVVVFRRTEPVPS